jgi:hypothetical protein
MQGDLARRGAMLAAVLALSAPAAAQQRPTFPPTRDVAATYRASISGPGAPQEFVLRVEAATGRARLEGELPGYVLVDLKSRRASIVVERMGLMVDVPPDAGLEQAFVLENASRFTRKGTDTVAGLRCTVWDIVADAASGTACVTADGVVLRAAGHDRKGRTGSLEATRVQYGRQAEALFFPPPNVHRLDIAAGPGGKGVAGLLSGPAAAAVLDRLRGHQP